MTHRPYITCRELIDFIADYLDTTLATDVRLEFERHLAVCPSCVAYLDSYRQTIRMGKAALQPTDQPVTGLVPDGLVRAIRAARQARRAAE